MGRRREEEEEEEDAIAEIISGANLNPSAVSMGDKEHCEKRHLEIKFGNGKKMEC